MLKILGRRSQKAGLPPGTPIYVGEHKDTPVKITVIDYDQESFEVRTLQSVEECFPYKDRATVSWINIDGLHNVDIIEQAGKYFGMHPLLIEDILNTQQRLKIDIFDDYLLIVFKMHRYNPQSEEVLIEQVSLVLGQYFVITFQEQEGDVFQSLRERLQNPTSRLRKSGTDYLAYALIDTIIDSFFELLEYFGEQVEAVEEDVIDTPDSITLQNIHFLKRELLFLRKSVWPLRGIINELQRQEYAFIQTNTSFYFRDLYDHVIQVIETADTLRDMVNGSLDIYLSSMSNRMNEIMQFLTIIGTIFIPLTFIAGIYGMNFAFMPELQWKWGYFAILFVMLGIGAGLLLYFNRKKWI